MERFAALHAGEWMDFCQSDNPMCPHCASVTEADDKDFIYEEGLHSVECHACGADFYVDTIVHHSFSTHNQPDDKSRQP